MATLLAKNPSLLLRAVTTAGGAMAGRGVDIGVEALRGYESRDWESLAADLGMAGVGAGVGEGVAPAITGIMNAVTQRGAKDALAAGRREVIELIEADPYLKELGFGQNPEGLLAILRGRFKQFDKHLRIQESEQAQGLVKSLQQLAESEPPVIQTAVNAMSDADLMALQKSLADHATNTVQRLLSVRDRTLSLDQAGKQVQWGLFDPAKEKSFRVAAGAIENKRWAAVKELSGDDFEFDLAPLLGVIDDLTRTHAVQGQKGPVLESKTLPQEVWNIINKVRSVKDGKVPKMAELFEEVDTGLVDQAGHPVTRRESLGLHDGFEFLKTLREDLGDFFGHDNVLSSRDEATARRMWGAFKDVLEGPRGPDSAAFKKALGRANKATAFKHEVLETNDMLRMAKSDNPASIMSAIEGGSLGFSQLQLLRRTMPAERWDHVTTYLKQDLVEHPEKIKSVLDTGLGADRKRLALFLNPAEQQALRNYAKQIKTIDGNVFAKTLKSQTEESARAYDLLVKATPSEMRQLVQHGDAATKLALKSATIEGIIRNSMRDEFGEISYNTTVITKNLDKLFNDKGMVKKLQAFLTPEEIKFLKDRSKLASYLSGKGFSQGGAGIAAGAIGGQATDVTNPMGIVAAVLTARSIGLMSRAVNTPAVLKYINNATDPFEPSAWLRTASVIATGLASQEARRQKGVL
ncbi:MAG TPA: hypothetical protein VMX74_05225 [Pirellulales bacterium]|nr:hypothetical protein [Pirellulales bacterium]